MPSTPADDSANRTPRPVSMMDVAAAAGVSQKTVSRVVNDEPHVSPVIRERVLGTIAELGFRPNSAARVLKGQRSRRIGVITIATTLHGPASTLAAIERETRTRGFSLTVVRTDETAPEDLQPAVDSLLDQNVEAIVISEPVDHHLSTLRIPADVTVLTFGQGPDEIRPGSLAIAMDESGGARAATDHLLALGHETVWHISGPTDWIPANRRVAGWAASLEDAGAARHEPLVGDWSPRSGFEAMSKLLQRPDVTAVFVANDQMAIGAMSAIQAKGLRVPDDISIVGFDDNPVAEFLAVPLTTIHQDFAEAARQAMHRLFRTLDGHPPIESARLFAPQLVTRSSTAKPSPDRRRVRPVD
ncbi:LacI family DNA-binding transcriptional regulator [Frondihabitans sp. VKM Ac-2883]|uniref:LacI family DNA-binding transcriptional regulator n=1 Tax=Frondihabitans sp. VKM Ac-2883 TaxID=2783823 RepID=UPI00188A2FBB|nr:LacI family DNA-binding transcriptional regulator [Frondihabitans sp. VKM Ac-2883]MBF4574633.1 LacI family DNA-binding transcriptional regulator [Frondihabitans sp. VKM Ac-2883]